ncbi:MAG TPA: SCO family protein [Gemmatimonadota bacterium]|nr:SCO family protein [Gemmatimonadota bacterium]
MSGPSAGPASPDQGAGADRPGRGPRATVPGVAAAVVLALAVGFGTGLVVGRGGISDGPAGGGSGPAAASGAAAGGGPAGGEGTTGDLGPAPSWELTDQAGRTVRSSELEGKVRVVTFLFPYCRTYCPLIAAHLRGLDGTLQAAGLADRVQLVAFNVDPAHTGPDQMRTFLRQYGWDPDARRMEYLTGPPDEIRRVVRDGYRVDYRRVEEGGSAGGAEGGSGGAAPGGGGATPGADLAPQPEVANALADSAAVSYDVVHNDGLALVGPDGRIRAYYAGADRLSDERLLEAIRALLSGG